MTDQNIAQELVETLKRPDGSDALRPVHSIGIGATGSFTASPEAQHYCKAQHFDGTPVDVTMRFSNGSGCAIVHDGWSDVRGMATRFHLKGGSDTDLIAMTLPEFFGSTPEKFLEFAIAAKPTPIKRESPWRKILDMLQLKPPMRNPYPGETISPDMGAIEYANNNAESQLAVFQAAAIGAPVSYARASYHAVHTFVITGPDGVKRWVRFNWQPVAGVLNTDPLAVPDDAYLQKELRKRVAKRPARFTLMMVVGETGDDFNNSTKPWPPHRDRIIMGELEITGIPEDQEAHSEKLSFNPGLLTDGIEASDDPVLHVRKEAYEISSKWRDATPCPFSRS